MGHSSQTDLIFGISFERSTFPDDAYDALDFPEDSSPYVSLNMISTGHDFNGPKVVGFKSTHLEASCHTPEAFDRFPSLDSIDAMVLVAFCNEFGLTYVNPQWHLTTLYG